MDNDGLWKHILYLKRESWKEPNNDMENKKELWWSRDLKRAKNGGNKELISWKRDLDCREQDKIKFWHDVWRGDEPFMQKYLRLYKNSLNKDAKVRDLGS